MQHDVGDQFVLSVSSSRDLVGIAPFILVIRKEALAKGLESTIVNCELICAGRSREICILLQLVLDCETRRRRAADEKVRAEARLVGIARG